MLSHQGAGGHGAHERGDERHGHGVAQLTFSDRGKIDRRDIKSRFARARDGAGAAGDIAVRAVLLYHFPKYGERTVAAERTDDDKAGEFGRDP